MTDPWIWEKVEGPNLVTEHTLKGPDVLCRYWYDNPPSDHAHLIAAAADLLAALEAVYDAQGRSSVRKSAAFKLARAAIAKARNQ